MKIKNNFCNIIENALIIKVDLCNNRQIKPYNREQFGYFLAGLVDADGHIAKEHFQITFNARDLSVAYYIRAILKCGRIYKFKKVKAYDYRCGKIQDRQFVSNLILNKLRLPQKIIQFNERLATFSTAGLSKPNIDAISLNTHWFAGFTQGDGSFQVRIRPLRKRSKNHQVEILLNFEIKHEYLLKQIQSTFGGIVGYRKNRNTYYYSSINLTNASKLVSYFDVYQVMGSSYRIYLLWRAALHLVLEKVHLTEHGLKQIRAIQDRMKQLKDNT